jgi:flagellar biosynthetic protein FlhB
MADETDDSQKTEDPSGRKLLQARERGQVIQSREVGTWFMLAMGGGLVLTLGPSIGRTIQDSLRGFFVITPYLAEGGLLWGPIEGSLKEVALALVLPLILLLAAAIGGNVAQTGLVFATEKFQLDISRLSPISGFGRLFKMRTLIDFLKNLGKVAIVTAVVVWIIMPEMNHFIVLTTVAVEDIMSEIYRVLFRLVIGVLVVLTALALGDYVYQRFSFMKSMRMSKQEVKEEHKQSEGDPAVRARLRQIRMSRARRRMMAAVPTASVVVTNPTHFAVALKYEMGAAGAPKLVAKGADLIALRIRELAAEHDIPVVENPPLARALYAGVDIDREIPAEHYKAVAEIIGYVFRLKGKMKGNPARPAAHVLGSSS